MLAAKSHLCYPQGITRLHLSSQKLSCQLIFKIGFRIPGFDTKLSEAVHSTQHTTWCPSNLTNDQSLFV